MKPFKRLIIPLGVFLVILGGIDDHHSVFGEDAQMWIPPAVKPFSPKTVLIKVGETVTWENRDGDAHFLTSSGPSSQGVFGGTDQLEIHHYLQPGQRFSHFFQETETYHYFCAIHMEMWGSVEVVE